MNVTIYHQTREAPFEIGRRRQPTREELEEFFEAKWEGELTEEQLNEFLREHGREYEMEAAPHAFLEKLWLTCEIGGEGCPIPRVIGDPRGPIRSFMVGDVVDLEGEKWVVAMVGWERVEFEEGEG